MSLLSTNGFIRSNAPRRAGLSTRVTYTSTPASTGTLLVPPSDTSYVMVKMWGAGGHYGTNGSNGSGGSGGYATYTFTPQSGTSYYISVGRAGGRATANSGGSIMNGGGSTATGGGGGDASALFKLVSTTYTVCAVAGGGAGGGSLSGSGGGAGGGSSGSAGTASLSGGAGSAGTGGAAGGGLALSGNSATLTAASLTGIGGDGASSNTNNGAGGGGYGGGGGGSTTNGAGGGGGAGLINTSIADYMSGSTSLGNTSSGGATTSPPSTGDADYVSGIGTGSASTTGQTPGDGYIVVYYYRYNAVSFTNTFTDRTTAASSTVPAFDFALFPIPTLSASNSSITTTTASTVTILGAPLAGTNQTLTNKYALRIATGGMLLSSGSAVLSGGAVLPSASFSNSGFTSTMSTTTLTADRTLTLPNVTDTVVTLTTVPTPKLGYAQITSNFTTTSTSDVQITGLSSSVTVPSGGRGVRITVFASTIFNSVATGVIFVTLWQGTVGSGTLLQRYQLNYSASTAPAYGMCLAYHGTPSAGSYTYNVGLRTSSGGGTANVEAASTYPAFILVELM